MYGVFHQSELSELRHLHDQHVYLFDSESAAYDFAFAAMVEAGLIDGKVAKAESLEDRQLAVHDAQDTFGSLTYLHVYPVIDRRG